MEFIFYFWTKRTVIQSKKKNSFISVLVNINIAYTQSQPQERISKALLSNAIKIFLWLKDELKLAILNKTLTRVNTGHQVLPEHIGKPLLKFSQKTVLSCDTLS